MLVILELLLWAVGGWLVVTQVAIPAFMDQPMFPMFTKRAPEPMASREARLQVSRDDLAKLRARREAIRARSGTSGYRDPESKDPDAR